MRMKETPKESELRQKKEPRAYERDKNEGNFK